MDIDLDAVLEIITQQAKAAAMLKGQLVALQKHSAKQAEELAALRKLEPSNLPAQAVCASDQGLAER